MPEAMTAARASSQPDLTDAPLPFDDAGRPKATFWALDDGLRSARLARGRRRRGLEREPE
jgi:hypothetical protein